MSGPTTVIGIQGGPGSFNDSAIHSYLSARPGHAEIRYLETTPKVLAALASGEVDLGQFAIYNSHGGLYEESLHVMARAVLEIVDQYHLPIAHALMTHGDIDLAGVDKIITHAEVIKHCRRNLRQRYPRLDVEVGQGELTDPAAVARALAEGRLPRSVATVSNALLADLYDLTIADSHVEDSPDSESTFLLVARG